MPKDNEVKESTPTWMYHEKHDPKLFDSAEEAKKAEKKGWVDSPDKVKKAESEEAE